MKITSTEPVERVYTITVTHTEMREIVEIIGGSHRVGSTVLWTTFRQACGDGWTK